MAVSRIHALLGLFPVLCVLLFGMPSPAQTDSPPESRLEPRGVFVGNTARPLRYHPDGKDFVIQNGAEFFNRPLYCMNSAFRIDGGDKPEFSFYVPGRGGNLRFGIRFGSSTKWLNDAATIITRYRPGSLLYEIHDPILGNATLRLAVLPLAAGSGVDPATLAKGLVARADLQNSSRPLELVWAFGGANGMRGSRGGDIGCEREPVSEFFQLRADQCAGNQFEILSNRFVLHSRVGELVGTASEKSVHSVCDASKWDRLDELLRSAGEPTSCPVAVGSRPLREGDPFFLVLQQGPPAGTNRLAVASVPNVERELAAAFSAAENARQAIATRVAVDTPDPFINAAAAAIDVAGDAIWDETQGAYMHGAVAWRNKLLGWRGPYTADALGWHDRAKRHLEYWAGRQNVSPIPESLPPADARSNLARNESALHSNGDLSNSHYDMNLVYIDALFRHLLWTGDLDLAKKEWPVIERHLAWERRLFRRTFGPEQLPLYEAYAAIWASDDMQFNGAGVAYTSAYNFYHNKMAARIATLLGKDPTPYSREADLIAKGMRQYLWLGDRGWFAESKDLLGLQLPHPSAGLWTFYHTIDSEVPAGFESWQMSRCVDTQISHIPIQGPGVPQGGYYTLSTTAWMPYVWSVNNVVMAEAAHTALGFWQADRGDDAFLLFKGCLLDGMYMGLCPGNVGMSSYFDMARHEAQRDFADAIGVYSRTLVEGLFGIHPDALAGELRVRPGFPADWMHAEIQHPDFDLAWSRDKLTDHYQIESRFATPMKVRLQVRAFRDGIRSVTVNGDPARWRVLDDSVGAPYLEIDSPETRRADVVIQWTGTQPDVPSNPPLIGVDGEFRAHFTKATPQALVDPARTVANPKISSREVSGRAAAAPGFHTAFVKVTQGRLTWWQPMDFEIRQNFEIVASAEQDATHLRFRIRNNTPDRITRDASLQIAGARVTNTRIDAPPFSLSDEIAIESNEALPGANRVAIEMDGKTIEGVVTNWKLRFKHETGFEPIPLDRAFNDRLTQLFKNDYLSPRSLFCSLAMPSQGIGGWCDPATTFVVNDTGLRAAARLANGRFSLPQGISFNLPTGTDASNVCFVSQWDNYPRSISVPLAGRAAHVYLFMAGSSNPMQSQFDNGEIVVTYADSSAEHLPLRNPTNWWPIDQDYFIDDFAFRRPDPIPPRVDLGTGTVRLLDPETFKGKGGKVPGGSAIVLDLPLNHDKELKSLTVTARANEVVIGLMAATLVR